MKCYVYNVTAATALTLVIIMMLPGCMLCAVLFQGAEQKESRINTVGSAS